MATFRIRDLIVAVGLGRRAAAPEQPDAPAAAAGEAPAGHTRGAVEAGGGCLTGTHALYVCLAGPSVVPDCTLSTTHLAMACHAPSIMPACTLSTTHMAMACHAPSVMPACTLSTTHAAMACRASAGHTCGYTDPNHVDPVACMSPDELTLLKRQLAEVMEQVEQREAALRRCAESDARLPRTIAEVDDLERKLQDALEELKGRRADLLRSGKATD